MQFCLEFRFYDWQIKLAREIQMQHICTYQCTNARVSCSFQHSCSKDAQIHAQMHAQMHACNTNAAHNMQMHAQWEKFMQILTQMHTFGEMHAQMHAQMHTNNSIFQIRSLLSSSELPAPSFLQLPYNSLGFCSAASRSPRSTRFNLRL